MPLAVNTLSIALQIGESLKRFGISEDSQHLLVARFDATPQDVSAAVSKPCRRHCLLHYGVVCPMPVSGSFTGMSVALAPCIAFHLLLSVVPPPKS